MTHTIARQFWRTYLIMASENHAHVNMTNPAIDFTARANIGEFANLPDEEYAERLTDMTAISSFWENGQLETVGNLLLNALSKTNISDSEVDKIAGILADASVNTDYCSEESEETQECDEESLLNPCSDFSPVDEPTPFDKGWTPRIIYNYLCKHVCKQDAAKKAVSMLVYNHLKGNSRNIVMAGATGCGKTEIWRALSKKFDCIRILNGPLISCDGWNGSYHVKDIFWNEPRKTAEHLIIVIDEADKLFEPMIGSSGTDHARKIQDEFLKIMDGDTLTFIHEKNQNKKITVDCSGVSMVFCGSFERMLEQKTKFSKSMGFGQQVQGRKKSTVAEFDEEDLIKYGNVRREIAGRISRIVTLDPLDADDFEAIMDSPASPIQKIEKSHKVSLSVDKDSRKKLASVAADKGLGCRFIRNKLQSLLDEQMFDNPDSEKYELYYE